jgi:hypothetical protein
MESLFNRVSVFDAIQIYRGELRNAFTQVTDAQLEADPMAITAALVEQFSLQVPVLNEAEKYAETNQKQIDVSNDPNRHFIDRSRPHYVSGTEIRVVVPFEGDPQLFEVQPATFTVNPPFAEIRDKELHIVYEITRGDFDIDGNSGRTITEINSHLSSLRDSAEQWKTELQQFVQQSIEHRKVERRKHEEIVGRLKMPVKRASDTGTAVTASQEVREDAGTWDVFICHASEDKEAIAKPLAEALEGKGLRVWYDDFSLKLGDSLRQSIDRGLAGSRYGVVILSGYFFQKHWPQQELNGLVSLEGDGKKVVLPIWHGVGAAEVRGYSPILADRKAANTKDGVDYVVEKITEVVSRR